MDGWMDALPTCLNDVGVERVAEINETKCAVV